MRSAPRQLTPRRPHRECCLEGCEAPEEQRQRRVLDGPAIPNMSHRYVSSR
ncbi:hypothetical protein G7075_08810 [Phycicoccus sp. HDW14]|uniref:hypothetical protein n=1 Tax=Phycicoccus sp. HDW14 TaxID=2714941 RepID=UPI0014084511|nr:hypothetical protein [Phycicoccus sp. HDW14]QIM21206.1 hypothetical protein G7075_08810 [Phycicoccus sp. HDW14]